MNKDRHDQSASAKNLHHRHRQRQPEQELERHVGDREDHGHHDRGAGDGILYDAFEIF
jgi:hypothetical protein